MSNAVHGLDLLSLRKDVSEEEFFEACRNIVSHYNQHELFKAPARLVRRKQEITNALKRSIIRSCKTEKPNHIHRVKIHFPAFVYWNYVRPVLRPSHKRLQIGKDGEKIFVLEVRNLDS
jgi:hypothetical protein